MLVTAGATEAMAAAVLGLCEPGDEVLMLEPHYDSYPAVVAMSGGTGTGRCRCARTRPAGSRSTSTSSAAAVGAGTRLLILNSPHNPTGTVLTDEELAGIARRRRSSTT